MTKEQFIRIQEKYDKKNQKENDKITKHENKLIEKETNKTIKYFTKRITNGYDYKNTTICCFYNGVAPDKEKVIEELKKRFDFLTFSISVKNNLYSEKYLQLWVFLKEDKNEKTN